jgi:hypothetical protein
MRQQHCRPTARRILLASGEVCNFASAVEPGKAALAWIAS